MKKIAIVGHGVLGATVSKALQNEGVDVIVVDEGENAFEKIYGKPAPESYAITNPYKDLPEIPIHGILPNMPKRFRGCEVQPFQPSNKIGRNDKCECGSGKKNKNCCKK